MSRTVQLTVAGQAVKVVSSASDDELRELVAIVTAKVAQFTASGGRGQQGALILAAIALAHELKEERLRRKSVEERTRELLGRVLSRVDAALDVAPGASEP